MDIEYTFLKEYCPNSYNMIYIHQVIGLLNKYTALQGDSRASSYYDRVKRLATLHPLVVDPSLGKKKQLIVRLLQMKLYWVVVVYYRYKNRQN